jgi:putative transcriptional regulator
MAKRDLFGELMEGVAAMKNRRLGKITLRSHKVEVAPLPKVDSKLLRDTRKKLR